MFLDKLNGKWEPASNGTGVGGTTNYAIPMPKGKVLGVQCWGEGAGSCVVTITGTDPAPQQIAPGPTQKLTVMGPFKNPPTAPPSGFKVQVDCGNTAPLWTGKKAQVTVVLRGAKQCPATVTADTTESESAGEDSICHTFHDATKLTASCGGNGNEFCEFQVVEVIEL